MGEYVAGSLSSRSATARPVSSGRPRAPYSQTTTDGHMLGRLALALQVLIMGLASQRPTRPDSFSPGRSGYCGPVLPLGFPFDVDAVLLEGVAHRADRRLLQAPLPPGARSLGRSEVYCAERCPRECPVCRPAFETLLSFHLERPTPGLAS